MKRKDNLAMDLKDKRILFISPKLFGIPEKIQGYLSLMGASIDYYDERPGNNFLTKALIRINRNLIGAYINRYHSKIIGSTKQKKYDFIFFIKGESFSEKNLKKLLNSHKESKSVVYHWDSIDNNPNALNLLNYFDNKYSFDRNDCEKLGMRFLPLFYYEEYKFIPPLGKETPYNLMFVGTIHSDRYKIIDRLSQQMTKQGLNVFRYFYFQGKIMFYKYLITHKESRGINRNEVHFTPVNGVKLLDLYRKSKIIVDINHPRQTGLTLRCIETLGAKRKLVTTNPDIVNYDFYNPKNILVIDRQNPIIPEYFLNDSFEDVPMDIYNSYSLSTWCSKIFQ